MKGEYCVLWTIDKGKIVGKCGFVCGLESKMDKIAEVCKHSQKHSEGCQCSHCQIRNIITNP